MTAIEPLLRQPAVQAVGWALLQFVWQGTLIAALTALALAALRRSAADVRYVVASIGLSLMLTVPVVSAVQGWRSAVPEVAVPTVAIVSDATDLSAPVTTAATAAGAVESGPASESGTLAPRASRIEMAMPLLLVVWASGVLVLSLRLISGWLWVQRMRTHGTTAADEHFQQMVARLSRRLHIGRAVRLVESTLVDVPTVIGWLKPVVLLPASALSGLSPGQLEAVLAHELAHIRRHDYLVNFLQTLVETLLFYHPAVWWLSHRIRVERENCCDDLAVSLCGDPYTYASALADLEELRGGRGRLALAVTGGSLLQRVRRLLGASSHAGAGPGWLAGGAAVILITGVTVAAVGQSVLGETDTPARGRTTNAAHINGQRPLAREAAQLTREAGRLTRDAGQLTRETAQLAREARRMFVDLSRSIDDMLRGLTGTSFRVSEAATQTPPAAPMPPEPPLPPLPPEPAGAANADAHRQMEERARAMAEQASAIVEAAATHAQAALAVDAARAAVEAAQSESGRPAAVRQERGSGSVSWSNGREKVKVEYRGSLEFTDDDTDVAKMSPGGYLKIADGGWFASHTVEFHADQSGTIQRRYWEGSSEKPFDPQGRQWLAGTLPRFIRQTGLGASQRVARFLKAGGPAAVLAEISKIEGSWAKRRYFTELINSGSLDSTAMRDVLVQAGREMDSDFELASLLIDGSDRLLVDEGTRQAYFEAARTIESDFEARRAYTAALKKGPVPGPLLASLLDASTTIASDFELASLLIEIVKLQTLDAAARAPFFRAADTIDSDFELRRVLTALANRDRSAETLKGVVEASSSIDSDFEMASTLLEVLEQQGPEGALRDPFFSQVKNIASSFERSRVLAAVVKRSDASADTVTAVLRSLDGMGDFETSQVLKSIAQRHTLSGDARDLYIKTAERLGDFHQNEALAALVRQTR